MDWITLLDAMDPLDDHLSLADIYMFRSSSVSGFGALHASTSSPDVMSAHNDVRIWWQLAKFRILCRISKRTSMCGFLLSGILLDATFFT
jgi:hypothetical protein